MTDSRGPPPSLEVERQMHGPVVTSAAVLMMERSHLSYRCPKRRRG